MEIILYFIKNHKQKLILLCLVVLQILFFLPLITKIYKTNSYLAELKIEVGLQKDRLESGFSIGTKRPKQDVLSLWLDEDTSLKFSNWYKDGQKDLFIRPRSVTVKQILKEQASQIHLSYTGLFRTEKDVTAMIKDLSTGRNHFKKKGDKIAGYKIMEIKKDVITLSDPAGSTIQLPKGGRR